MRLKDEQKFEAIIRATLELTHEKGLAGIKMSELARKAGIATGSLYTYFEDKQDILLSVDREVRSRGAAYLMQASTDDEENYEGRVKTYVGQYADFVSANREAILFIDLLQRSPFMTERSYQDTVDQYRFTLELVEEGQNAGLVREGDPEEMVHVIDSIIKMLIDHRQTHLKGAYDEEVRNRCKEYVWAVLKK
ncbi:TetR/AcrR family transcriptional regulator [Neolewinella agarilytica]|uniref:Transcriptional regulator, TetR family n=1 Tax=Neolewinella agarilytica TaxID=478744 RepID=A0A1H9G6H8_9BACT|nr:TetR/AcrR family transcriptional regulator [Neolewinella agarilytica]SEQ45691.1 transcriptional regulator, TetR family [Neolewinella agarilytica]